MAVMVAERQYLPAPGEAFDSWGADLGGNIAPERLLEVRGAIGRLYAAAAGTGGDNARARAEVRDAYGHLRAILCTTPLGMPTLWPATFWQTALGRLVYYAHERVYGDDLLSQSEVAELLGYGDVQSVAREEREGRLEYLADPDAPNPRRDRRRVTIDMVRDYQRRHQGAR